MKKKKQLSELQKANLLTGQLLRRCYCTTELIKFLKEQGCGVSAEQVESALTLGRRLAYREVELAKLRAKKDDCSS